MIMLLTKGERKAIHVELLKLQGELLKAMLTLPERTFFESEYANYLRCEHRRLSHELHVDGQIWFVEMQRERELDAADMAA